MVQIEIETKIGTKEDIRKVVWEIWRKSPHQWDNEDIFSEIEKGIEEINVFYKSNGIIKNKTGGNIE